MKSNQNHSEKYKRAQKRVKNLKDFYKHLRVFVIINILLLIIKSRAYDFFTERGIMDEGFFNWLDWNIIGTPIIWGFGLGLHAIYVFVFKSKPLKEFAPRFYKDWEERQIEKYMNEESNKKD